MDYNTYKSNKPSSKRNQDALFAHHNAATPLGRYYAVSHTNHISNKNIYNKSQIQYMCHFLPTCIIFVCILRQSQPKVFLWMEDIITILHYSRCLQPNKNILSYFSFTFLRMAVVIHSGDFLILNSQKHYLISSKCNNDDVVYCVSMYVKTAVVVLNGNSIELGPMMELLNNTYH